MHNSHLKITNFVLEHSLFLECFHVVKFFSYFNIAFLRVDCKFMYPLGTLKFKLIFARMTKSYKYSPSKFGEEGTQYDYTSCYSVNVLDSRLTWSLLWRRSYKVFQIWPGLIVCKQVIVCPGHIWTTLYLNVAPKQ